MTVSYSRALVGVLALALALPALVRLESARIDTPREEMVLGNSPATLYRGAETSDQLVIVSHGFAGSRQMMEAISETLARTGHTVVAFDYQGHGRHTVPLSPDITTLTGTTEDLVQQTLGVVADAQARTGLSRVSLVGHSMATDVVIRAAARLPKVESVAAISMYSEAVTAQHPERLLIISGAQEGRLRRVALEAVAQIGKAVEGETIVQNGIERRAIAALLVGHVGVLWSPTTSAEIANWLGTPARPSLTGLWLGLLLAAVTTLFWPIAGLFPQGAKPAAPPLRRAVLAAVAPVPVALAVSYIDLPLLGLAGFGTLWLFLGAWGAVALLILRWRPLVEPGATAISAAMLLFWGLGVFALCLDRYGAAFLPAGPRLSLMLMLLPAALLFAVADRALVQGRALLLRVTLRLPMALTLLGTMVLNVDSIGMLFTVLPVLVLFWAVYGTAAYWVGQRTGPAGPMIASGIILAWSIAASTPLFSTG